MANKQLNDDGAVIGYQPKLYYDKERDVKTVVTNNDKSTSGSNKVIENHTRSFIGFINNSPMKVINTLDFVSKSMNKTIDKLSKSFDGSNCSQCDDISSLLTAIDNDDMDSIKEFVDYHRDNIKGDIVPELIEVIYETKKRIETIRETMKELYFGSNLTDEQCIEMENAYIDKIRQYELSGDFQKINYASITFDSTLNRSVSTYAFNANKQCILLSDVVTKTDSSVTNDSLLPMVEELFHEISDDIKTRNDTYELQQNVEIVQKTLYNYYNKRQELVNLYDLLGDSESVFLTRKLVEYQDRVDEAIVNVNRTFIGNQLHLTELEKMESEKRLLSNIYNELSNKS